MNKRTTAAMVLGVGAMLFAAGTQTSQAQAGTGITQAQLDSAKKAAASARKQTVAANMTLSAAQAKAFWPVYDAYRAEVMKIKEKQWNALHQMLTAPDSITDAKANMMTNMWLSLQMQEQQLRARYFPKFTAVLGSKLTMRYFQVEHRMDLMVAMAFAEEIPLVY